MLNEKEHAEKVLQREKAIKKEMADFARTLEITNNKSDYNRGYSDCRKEYEEKLRWIPVEEKLPELRKRQYMVESMSKSGIRSYWIIDSQYDIDSLKEYRVLWRYFL